MPVAAEAEPAYTVAATAETSGVDETVKGVFGDEIWVDEAVLNRYLSKSNNQIIIKNQTTEVVV